MESQKMVTEGLRIHAFMQSESCKAKRIPGRNLAHRGLCFNNQSSQRLSRIHVADIVGLREVHSRVLGASRRRAVLVRSQDEPVFGGEERAETQKERSIQLYGQIERVFSESARRGAGDMGRWEDFEGVYVLRPPPGSTPTAVVHFIGGAFVGASPQLTYRLFLERLSARFDVVVVATPYASTFDHSRIADETHFKFERCLRAISDAQLASLPVFGIGHSLGALTHVLIGCKYVAQRAGNILLSYNNKDVSEAVPLLSPVIMPLAQRFGPLLQQLTTSRQLGAGAQLLLEQLKSANPGLVKDLLPLLEQLPPLYEDLVEGKGEFIPSPEDTWKLIRTCYGVRRNLVIGFDSDTIDESGELTSALRGCVYSVVSADVVERRLPGDHARPLQQALPELPQGVADAIAQGGALLAGLTGGTPFANMARDLGAQFGSSMDAQKMRQSASEDIDMLVDEVGDWMGEVARRPAMAQLLPDR
eukprot:TRINITY_DN3302_c0_g1_i1.p1 TRINITY_DN3302_c0_g1~~TRINITY_DN3302_c0_g1_i1.p1  ORF type:complete len:475 (+),score=75.96 TRINITY_DN3302_c0_g1_i1:321-1745(+)